MFPSLPFLFPFSFFDLGHSDVWEGIKGECLQEGGGRAQMSKMRRKIRVKIRTYTSFISRTYKAIFGRYIYISNKEVNPFLRWGLEARAHTCTCYIMKCVCVWVHVCPCDDAKYWCRPEAERENQCERLRDRLEGINDSEGEKKKSAITDMQ